MGTITAQSIIDDVSVLLFDKNNVKWARSELLLWLNQAQRRIVTIKPSAFSQREVVQLSAGTKQSLPAGGFMVLDLGMTMGDDGATPGHAMRLVSRQALEGFNPDYPIDAQVEEPKEWWFDVQEPEVFHVSPPADGNGYVTLVYAKMPTIISSEATAISVNDVYEPAIMAYMMFKASSKKVVYASGDQTAAQHWQDFEAALKGHTATELTNNPNLAILPRSADLPGSNS